ncbi:hypothetical protein HY025_04825 [Candidatus Daviesbacteria bacterium]|nr:hypothetical protein [Candidatus Daviesbacteria bacterium]
MLKKNLKVELFQSKLLITLTLVSLLLAIYFYWKYNSQQRFLTHLWDVQRVGQINKKIANYIDANNKILLLDDSLNEFSAKVVVEGIVFDSNTIRIQNVPFYQKTYFIVPYGLGEGGRDYLIFDSDGRVITKTLLYDLGELNPSEISNVRDDGTLYLKVFKDKSALELKVDFTTGKLK